MIDELLLDMSQRLISALAISWELADIWWHGSKPSISRAAFKELVPDLGKPAPITCNVS